MPPKAIKWKSPEERQRDKIAERFLQGLMANPTSFSSESMRAAEQSGFSDIPNYLADVAVVYAEAFIQRISKPMT